MKHKAPGATTALIVFFCLGAVAATYAIPWQTLVAAKVPPWIVQYTSDIGDYLTSANTSKIVALGSSLSVAALPPVDAKKESLTKRLPDATIPPIDLLSSPGKLVSDDLLLTRRLLARRVSRPGLILETVSFRDFHDNLAVANLSETPTSQMLRYLPDESNVFDFDRHWKHLKDAAVALRVKSVDFAEQSRKKRDRTSSQVDTDVYRRNNAEEYRQRYRPFNAERFEAQMEAFEKFVRLAAEEKQALIVINMPVTSVSYELIPDAVRAIWSERVKILCQNNGADFFDLQDAKICGLKDSDFSDTVHLSEDGRAKFAEYLSKRLKESPAYQAAFANRTAAAQIR